jgi:curli biogenesis system outer membrane secretion channel CsgG
MRRFAAVALFAVLLAAGCAGYQVGPTNGLSAGAKSVEINLFKNQTLEPRLSEPVAQALRERIHEDGSFRLATRGGADIVVTGTIVKFERVPLTFQPGDIAATRDYDARMTAQVRAVERTTGKVLFDREFTGRTLVEGVADIGSAERQASPLMGADIARKIVSQLADGGW